MARLLTTVCTGSARSAHIYKAGRAAANYQRHRRPAGTTAAMAVAPPAAATPPAPPSVFSFAEREALIPGMQRWVAFCNNGAEAAAAGQFVPLRCAGSSWIGALQPAFAQRLQQYADVFRQAADGSLELLPPLDTQQARTQAVARVLQQLREQGLISGWRDEMYPVCQSFHDEPAFLIERAAAPHFGIKAYGVHVNGYCLLPDGSKELWVARRSRSKPTWPGRLDHIVAGGQPHGLSCQANVVKECQEEASIPAELAQQAVPVGAVSYTSLQEAGLKRDVLYCYDLLLPLDFVPQPQDGEVEEFMRLPLDEVARLIAETDEYKDNCNLVITDFLMRHGYLTPDMRGYLGLLTGLRSGDCS